MPALPLPSHPPSSPRPAPEKLLVTARHGKFVVLGEDLVISLSLMYYGEFAEDEWQLMRRFIQPSHVVVDAGANLGAFTLPFSNAVGPYGHVHAFEPQPVIFDCLRETVALNRLGNVTLHSFCLGAARGAIEISAPDYNQPGNFGGVPFQEAGCKEAIFTGDTIRAPVCALDEVLKNTRLDFLKIDVEGMEVDVLKGAAATLARHRPVIYTENNRRERSPELIRLLATLGYRLWWHTGPFFNPNNFTGRADDIYENRHNINMLCLPPGMDDGKVPSGLRQVEHVDEHIFLGQGRVLLSTAEASDGN